MCNYTFIHVFTYINCSLSATISNNGKINRNKLFSSEKNDVFFDILIKLRFQGYYCKSGIAWGVT